MAIRIAGVDLPVEEKLDTGLTAIYGVGRKNVLEILEKAKLSPDKRIKELTSKEVTRLQKAMETLPTEGELRSLVSENIKRLKTIGSYRGVRHTKGLPVRGQRTRVNARTKRGKRKTIGAMRKKDLTKLGRGTEAKEKTKEKAKE